jgi:hypothetical protein
MLHLFAIGCQPNGKNQYGEGVSIVCAENKAEALALVRASHPGLEHWDDVEERLPVEIDQNTPKGVVHHFCRSE